MEISYQLWDVFTNNVLSGNPLAVLPEASGMSSELMQRVAREFNLSETSFVLSSDKADVRARYFTPASELPVAGHPTIGTVYALDALDRLDSERDQVRLELGVGVVPVTLERDGAALRRAWMNQGTPSLQDVLDDRASIAAAVGLTGDDLVPDLPVQVGSAGVPFLYVPVTTLAALARARATLESLTRLDTPDLRAVFVFRLDAGGAQVRARMLGPGLGITEDPATGSAHGPLGSYLATHGRLRFGEDGVNGDEAAFVSMQGVEMGRPSRIQVRVRRCGDSFEVHVGGSAVKLGEGRLRL